MTLLLCCGCATIKTDTITQASTIDALLMGQFDGFLSSRDLLKYGNFGIGTFNRLDGEMIILNNRIYQVRADGVVYAPAQTLLTPFASVCRFKPDKEFPIYEESDCQKIQKIIDKAIPNQNIFCAVKIRGKFTQVTTRSVPAQTKPYPPLVEVTKNQPVFELNDVSGTIVGFRCPAFVKGVNVAGYHFHFITDDFTKGGHILDFTLKEGACEIDTCHRYLLILPPEGKGLEDLDFSEDRSKELEKAEK